MTTDEMAAEIRTYDYDPHCGYAFISYSHMDRDQVYPVVLSWMRSGYNIYIDLDFEKHGSDQHWVEQMSKTLARSTCRLAVCFKSIRYTYSYAALLELLTIRSVNTTDRHRGKLLCVDSVTLELVPSDQDNIPASLNAMYQEHFNRMKLSMGQRFAGQNVMERDTLHDGLDDWLFHMEPETKTRLGYSRISSDRLIENIEATYEEGMQEFFPYIARLIKNWFDSQNLNGNDISPQADNRDRFAQVGVEQIRKPVTVPAPEAAPLPSAFEPKPTSVPMPKSTQKAEDVSVPKQSISQLKRDRDAFLRANSKDSAKPVQRADSQSVSRIQSVSMPDMRIEDGVLVKYDGPGGDVVIPEDVTKIGDRAFKECESLTSVIIPKNVKTIGEFAFCSCKSLTSVTIPESVMTIGEGAFCECESMVNVTIPKGVKAINKGTFVCCKSLASVTIPEGVTMIGEIAFSLCDSLTSVTIPNRVTTIDEHAFFMCENLTSVTILKGVTTIGISAFSCCHSLKDISVPASVSQIGEDAFKDCSSQLEIRTPAQSYAHEYARKHNIQVQEASIPCMQIEDGVLVKYDGPGGDVVIPDGIITIGKKAFSSCYNLASVTIPESVTTIGDNAFSFCHALISIIIPEGVTTIGRYAFGWCEKMVSVTIPKSVTTIEEKAFYKCLSLTSVAIPEGVKTIEEQAFYGCESLANITISNNMKAIDKGVFERCFSLTSVTIPEGVTTIGEYAFCDCIGLTSVTIPMGVTTVDNYAFRRCEKLTSVTIPESVTRIGYYAFGGCLNLRDIFIPASVSEIKSDAFASGIVERFIRSFGLVIHTPAQSYAHEYAKKHHIRVELI